MIQSKRIAELMDIYKQAEKCYKYNQSSSFYRCLENKLVLAARKYNDEKEILEEYKIACQSYLDSNILKTNISIAIANTQNQVKGRRKRTFKHVIYQTMPNGSQQDIWINSLAKDMISLCELIGKETE